MNAPANFNWEARRLASLADDPVGRRQCTIADAMAILGERWTVLVVRELIYGAHQFNQIVGFTGGSRDIIADRLRNLEAHGIIERRQYSEHPPRYEYHLTEAGQDLLPVLLSLATWGAKWAGTEPPSQAFIHDCGQVLQVDYKCRSCGQDIDANGIHPIPRTEASDR